MKILFDHQIFSWQRFGGVSRYFFELSKNLQRNATIKNSTLLSFNHYLKNDKTIPHVRITDKNIKGKERFINFLNKFNSIRLLKKQDYDVFHPTYYDPYFLPFLKGKPFILTIYDMIHELPNLLGDSTNDDITRNKKELIVKADKIIAISQNTKDDIIKLYGTNPSKIEVIYLGVYENETCEAHLPLTLPEHYILFVGARQGYKNFQRFANAFSKLHKKYPHLYLVCTGRFFSTEEKKLLNSLQIDNVTIQISATDVQLKQLYLYANLFVFPSLYEGFGLPILEAFLSECPVALSNSSCFPEIACDAAVYFEPTEIDSITSTMEKVISDKQYSNELIKRGKERLKFFSWQKNAEQTLKLYEEVKNNKNYAS